MTVIRHALLSGCRGDRSELLGFEFREGFSEEVGFRLGLAGWEVLQVWSSTGARVGSRGHNVVDDEATAG